MRFGHGSEAKPENRDHVLPKGRWVDAEVNDVFDEMLRRSILQVDGLRQTVFCLACLYAKYKTALDSGGEIFFAPLALFHSATKSVADPFSVCFLFPRVVMPKIAFCLIAAFLVSGIAGANAQESVVQPTPFTVLLDFASLKNPYAPKQALPIWLESVQVIHSGSNDSLLVSTGTAGTDSSSAQTPHTTFRLRLRPMPGLNDSLLLRLFFEDRPGARPSITGWSETGNQRFASNPLGGGLGLPASESMAIPTRGVDYLEIDVPGDGSTVSKALLATLKTQSVSAAFDFAPAESLADPFGSATPVTPGADDVFLFGRVRATLDAGIVKLAPAAALGGPGSVAAAGNPSTVDFEFNLESEPLLALISFDILNTDPTAPLEGWANSQSLGPVSVRLPDLADPAYVGIVRPFEKMRFHYTGWLHCQALIPGRALRAGSNTFTLRLPGDAQPVAVRAVELQLKHSWQKLDYSLSP